MPIMKNLFLRSFLLLYFLISIDVSVSAQSTYAEAGYTSLFNGADLAGWILPEGDNGHWSVIDGVIDYDALSEAEGSKDLLSSKDYKDFELHVEWRFKGYGDHLFRVPTILPDGTYLQDSEGNTIYALRPNSDSGILFKNVGQANLWCWDVGSGELWSIRTNKELSSDIRAAAVPNSNQDNPVGHWNAMDIKIQGERITIKSNGITIIDNALYPGLDIEGPIGFQHHGGLHPETGKLRGASSLVQFRNIWIKEL